jgi:hypothetical protein
MGIGSLKSSASVTLRLFMRRKTTERKFRLLICAGNHLRTELCSMTSIDGYYWPPLERESERVSWKDRVALNATYSFASLQSCKCGKLACCNHTSPCGSHRKLERAT